MLEHFIHALVLHAEFPVGSAPSNALPDVIERKLLPASCIALTDTPKASETNETPEGCVTAKSPVELPDR